MQRTPLALIGCGYWGKNHFRTLHEMEDVFLKYVCDSKEPSLRLGDSEFTRDYQKILRDESIVGAVISTPTTTHYSIAKEFLEAGKSVFVEKPLTTNSTEALELCRIADTKNACLMVGEVFKFNPAVAFIKELIDKGDLGTIRYFESRRVGLGPIRNDVSCLWDLATHDIYISNLFLGKVPVSVSCSGVSHNGKLDDVSCLNMRYENPNILSTIYVNWEHPKKERVLIVGGTKKAVTFDDTEPSEKVQIFERTVDYLPSTGDFGEFQSAIRSGSIIIPNIKLRQPLEEELRNFIMSIRGEEKCLSDGYSGLQTVRVLEAAEESRRNNCLEVRVR